MQHFDRTILDVLKERVARLEGHFKADIVFYYGPIDHAYDKVFRELLEKLAVQESSKKLVVLLNTSGGSAEAAEKMVRLMRFHYEEVVFVVPDFAMSAGTILCMSGNDIFMDYSSSLGPIDPQVHNGQQWVPARGYLDKYEQMLQKAAASTLTQAEFLILQAQDLAMLNAFEQACQLTVTLLKKWLVEYKFRNWKTHATTPELKGKPVTSTEKVARAEEIAKGLGDNQRWHTHNRTIDITELNALKLKIEDYSRDAGLRSLIRDYNDLIVEYVARTDTPAFVHSRNFYEGA